MQNQIRPMKNNKRLSLLDLFCGGGAAARGYHQAGFVVVGVDISPHPNYPYTFIQADALQFAVAHGRSFDIIHASPPCQYYSQATYCNPLIRNQYPDLIAKTREILKHLDKPYIIENVPNAPLINPILLCGIMFDLGVFRHRLFESNLTIHAPAHIQHGPHRFTQHTYTSLESRAKYEQNRKIKKAGLKADYIIVAGNSYNKNAGAIAMQLDPDKMTKPEVSEAIPPAYTHYIGKQLLKEIQWA